MTEVTYFASKVKFKTKLRRLFDLWDSIHSKKTKTALEEEYEEYEKKYNEGFLWGLLPYSFCSKEEKDYRDYMFWIKTYKDDNFSTYAEYKEKMKNETV